jgi:hypothetical protein
MRVYRAMKAACARLEAAMKGEPIAGRTRVFGTIMSHDRRHRRPVNDNAKAARLNAADLPAGAITLRRFVPAKRNAPMPSIDAERIYPMNLDIAEKELIETLRAHEESTGLTLVIEQSWGNWSITQSYPVGTANKASPHTSTAVGKGKFFKTAWVSARKADP